MTVTVLPDPQDQYTTGMVQDQSVYQDVMRYPILYKNAVDDDATNGLGALWDYTQWVTTWDANQVPTAQLIYPSKGEFASAIKQGMVIEGDINRDLTHQRFRVDGLQDNGQQITINLTHILGEFLTTPLLIDTLQMPNVSASWCIGKIFDNLAKDLPELNYDSDVVTPKNIDMDTSSSNAINALIDPDQQGDTPSNSVLANYGGDFIFDNFTLYHRANAGSDPNIWIKYGDRLQTFQQEQTIDNTYVGLYAYATYQPGQAQATESNVDWSAWSEDWTSIGSITYNAGGPIDIWDSPVKGHHKVGSINIGEQIKLGNPIANGAIVPDKLHPQNTKGLQVTTVWGHTWYPVATESDNGVGGWVDGTWINFDKTGDYVVNNAVGHVTVGINGTDQKLTRYPISGTATVNYSHGIQKIHVYYSPDAGKNHYRTTQTYKNGAKVHYHWIAIDENGDKWYQIGSHKWLYGPHLSIDKDTDVAVYPSQGKGKVEKGATKYHINTHTGEVTEARHNLSVAAARRKRQKPYKYVYRGRGKKRRKYKIRNRNYREGSTIKLRHKYYRLDYGQVSVGGTIYYKLSNGSYVRASQVDFKARYSDKPEKPDDIIEAVAGTQGRVEMYDAPSKAVPKKDGKVHDKDGNALNVSIPVGQSFQVDHTAQGADGQTWYEVTYDDITGWIPSEETTTTAVGDLEPQAPSEDEQDDPDDTEEASDSPASTSVDDETVQVVLDESFDNVHNGVLYPEGMYESENTRIMKLDLSSYVQHDNQDTSGLQADGTWQATSDDKRQLYAAALDALKEYQIGEFPVTLTVNDADQDSIEGDLTALHMYDTAHVDFVNYNGKTSEGRVTHTEWVMAYQDSHYQSVQIGKPPVPLLHLLSSRLNKNTNELKRSVGEATAHTGHLFSDMQDALKAEGDQRRSKEIDIAKQMGLFNDQTNKLAVSIETIDKQIQNIQGQEQQLASDILSGGTAQLQFLDANGDTNFLRPTQIRAVNTDGSYMVFNSEGLGFFDAHTGQLNTGMGMDGKVAAQNIAVGTLSAMKLASCEIEGALTVGSGSDIAISIGTDQPPDAHDSPTYGGNGIWLVSGGGYPNGGYEDMISSGRITIHHGNDYLTLTGVDGITWNGKQLKSDITVGNQKISLWS